MISETLPNWGGLKVENFGGKFKCQNLSSWNTLFSTLGGDEITFSGFIWGQELITKCPCWVKLHITEDNFCHFFKPPQFRFFMSKNVKLFEAIRSPLVLSQKSDELYWFMIGINKSDLPCTPRCRPRLFCPARWAPTWWRSPASSRCGTAAQAWCGSRAWKNWLNSCATSQTCTGLHYKNPARLCDSKWKFAFL